MHDLSKTGPKLHFPFQVTFKSYRVGQSASFHVAWFYLLAESELVLTEHLQNTKSSKSTTLFAFFPVLTSSMWTQIQP